MHLSLPEKIALTLLGVIFLAAPWGLKIEYTPFLPGDTEAVQKTLQLWTAYAFRNGATETLSLIRHTYKTAPPGDQHTAGHIAAISLLASLPLESSLPLCGNGDTFAGGCQHELIGQVLLLRGMTEAPNILALCEEKNIHLECAHAVGHVLMEGEAKNAESLSRALSACDELGTTGREDAVVGCPGGVFMEHNGFPLFSEGAKYEARFPQTEGLQEPCVSLGERERRWCYFWQPLWWSEVLPSRGGRVAVYAQMSAMCGALLDLADKRECFMGIGYRGIGDFGEEEALYKACTQEEPEYGRFCREGIRLGTQRVGG